MQSPHSEKAISAPALPPQSGYDGSQCKADSSSSRVSTGSDLSSRVGIESHLSSRMFTERTMQSKQEEQYLHSSSGTNAHRSKAFSIEHAPPQPMTGGSVWPYPSQFPVLERGCPSPITASKEKSQSPVMSTTQFYGEGLNQRFGLHDLKDQNKRFPLVSPPSLVSGARASVAADVSTHSSTSQAHRMQATDTRLEDAKQELLQARAQAEAKASDRVLSNAKAGTDAPAPSLTSVALKWREADVALENAKGELLRARAQADAIAKDRSSSSAKADPNSKNYLLGPEAKTLAPAPDSNINKTSIQSTAMPIRMQPSTLAYQKDESLPEDVPDNVSDAGSVCSVVLNASLAKKLLADLEAESDIDSVLRRWGFKGTADAQRALQANGLSLAKHGL